MNCLSETMIPETRSDAWGRQFVIKLATTMETKYLISGSHMRNLMRNLDKKKKKLYLFISSCPHVQRLFQEILTSLLRKRHKSKEVLGHKHRVAWYMLSLQKYISHPRRQAPVFIGYFIISLDQHLLGNEIYVRSADSIILYPSLHFFWHKMSPLIWANTIQYTMLVKQAFYGDVFEGTVHRESKLISSFVSLLIYLRLQARRGMRL